MAATRMTKFLSFEGSGEPVGELDSSTPDLPARSGVVFGFGVLPPRPHPPPADSIKIYPVQRDLVELVGVEVLLTQLDMQPTPHDVLQHDQMPRPLRRGRVTSGRGPPISEKVLEVQLAEVVEHPAVVRIRVGREFPAPRAAVGLRQIQGLLERQAAGRD